MSLGTNGSTYSRPRLSSGKGRGRFGEKHTATDEQLSLMKARHRTPHTREARPLAKARAAVARRIADARGVAATCALIICLASGASVWAQKKSFDKEYPAQQANVSVQLHNRSGTVEVETWEKPKVKVSARMESSKASVVPEMDGNGIRINVTRDNRGDVGDINFKIMVPANSTVDISTMVGNIIIRNVRGEVVRASVSSEGDIELTGIRARMVVAENTRGNILFDAELLRNGVYDLKSTQGDIQLRIIASAGFRLIATSLRTRNINLGGFAGKGEFNFTSNNRQVVGKVGDGGAALSTTNGLGSIVFMQR